MNKILYHPKEGTTGFFLIKDLHKPSKYDFDDNTDDYSYAMQFYNKLFNACKQEAINNGEIVNPQLIGFIETSEGIYHKSPYLDSPNNILKDGDTFDLPEGVKVKLENKECPELCSVGRCAFNECQNLDKVIRLVKEQPKQESKVELSEDEENSYQIRCEIANLAIDKIVVIYKKDQILFDGFKSDSFMLELQRHFTIQRKQNEYKASDDLHDLHWSADAAAELYASKVTEDLRKENEALKAKIFDCINQELEIIGLKDEIERLKESNKELVDGIKKFAWHWRSYFSNKIVGNPPSIQDLDGLIQKSEGNGK